jgi:N-acyl-D-amino-acid deacylase
MALHDLGSWENVLIAAVTNAKNKAYEGKSIADAARLRGQNPPDTVFDLLLEENGAIAALYFVMTEENVRYALPQAWVSIGSDGAAVNPVGMLGQGKPHPRWYGTFPRVLGKYVREEKVLTLEDAIRKMTSLAARQMGIHDRGLLREGMYADVVVFDAEHVTDKATFTDPHQYPTGIEYVIVNGKVVIEQSKHTGVRPGKILYGPGKQ